MSRITYRGPDRFTPRSRTAAQRQNEGRFREALKPRHGTLAFACFFAFLIVLTIFAYGALA